MRRGSTLIKVALRAVNQGFLEIDQNDPAQIRVGGQHLDLATTTASPWHSVQHGIDEVAHC